MEYYNQSKDLRDKLIIDDLLYLQYKLPFSLTKHIENFVTLTTAVGNSMTIDMYNLELTESPKNKNVAIDRTYSELYDSASDILGDQIKREDREDEDHLDKIAHMNANNRSTVPYWWSDK